MEYVDFSYNTCFNSASAFGRELGATAGATAGDGDV